MIRVQPVIDRRQIRSAAAQIRRRLRSDGKAYRHHLIGTPGGGWTQTLFWIPSRGFWGGVRVNEEGWHDLIYGLTDPASAKQIVPDAKTSLSVDGNRRLGGLIVRDHDGGLFLAHSGRIGGGKTGVSKAAFREAYNGPRCLVEFEDGDQWYAIVGRIDAPRFLEQVHDFVGWVRLFKDGNITGFRWRFSDDSFQAFKPEVGSKSTRRGADVSCTHQDVVNALQAELVRLVRGKALVTNDRLRDLIQISIDGKADALFEVKTSGDRQSVYTAIGQLLFNRSESDTKLTIVAPKELTQERRVVARLRELEIDLVGYTQSKHDVVFHGLRRRY